MQSKIKNHLIALLPSKENRQANRLFQAQNLLPIYHYHIRKTGGTSINFAFLSHATTPDVDGFYQQLSNKKNHRMIANERIFVGWNKRLIEGGKYFYAFSHTPAHELQLPKNTFTFTCLRDPARRVISHYKMLSYYRKNNIAHPCMRVEGAWLGDSLDDFIKNIPKNNLMNQLYMFSKNYNVEEAEEKIRACSTYFFTENINEGMADLSAKLNLELALSHQKKYEISILISESQMAYLKEKLAPEYRLLKQLKKP